MAGRKTLLVVLAGGGWSFEMRCLLRGLGNDFDYVYVVPQGTSLDMKAYPPGRCVHRVASVGTMSMGWGLRGLLNFARVASKALSIVWRERAIAVVAVGGPTAVPFFLWTRMLGRKAVFIESITHVNMLSRTGKLVAKFGLCDRLYVQWPEMAEANKGTMYQGVVI